MRFSQHARQQMIVRGISVADVSDAIQRGSKTLQKPAKILANYRYFCVVYRMVDGDPFVITVKPR